MIPRQAAKYAFKIASTPLWLPGAYGQNLIADVNDKAYWAELERDRYLVLVNCARSTAMFGSNVNQ